MKEDFGSLCASAVIFGLLAILAIWLLLNEFDVYFRWESADLGTGRRRA